jgi:DNA-binding transcriptional MerR regulator
VVKYLTSDELAFALRRTPDSIRHLAREGLLPAVRLRPHGRLLFDPAEVARALTPAAPQATTPDKML